MNMKIRLPIYRGVNKSGNHIGKYIISDTTVYVCEKCGEEYLEAEEYNRIQKKIEAIESQISIPAVHAVLAKSKFWFSRNKLFP